jgi:hypothetical protein
MIDFNRRPYVCFESTDDTPRRPGAIVKLISYLQALLTGSFLPRAMIGS